MKSDAANIKFYELYKKLKWFEFLAATVLEPHHIQYENYYLLNINIKFDKLADMHVHYLIHSFFVVFDSKSLLFTTVSL